MGKKIWVRVSAENVGLIEQCDECGLIQPDSTTAYRQLHYEDCPIAPAPSDLLDRMEELSKPRSEEPDLQLENERIYKAQEKRQIEENAKKVAEREDWNKKVHEGKTIPTAQSGDPNWRVKEQIGFLESAIRGRNLEFLNVQIQWATHLISNHETPIDGDLRKALLEKIGIATILVNELSD